MRKFTFHSVDDCEVVFSHGDYVVLSGKNPWIFRKDGTYIAKIKAIRNAYDMFFLPNNMVLMDGSGDRTYHYVSLETGEIQWSCPRKGRRYLLIGGITVSPDGKTIYSVYYEKEDHLCIDHIEPEKKKITTYRLPYARGLTLGYCNNDGHLFLLLMRYSSEEDKDGNEINHSEVGIFEWYPGAEGIAQKYRWHDVQALSRGICRFEDKYIFTYDLHAFNIETAEVVNLIENEPAIKPIRGGIVFRSFDPKSMILAIQFIANSSWIEIDCTARKIISHYRPISHGLTCGKVIDGEYWIGTFEGIVKRPHPHVDEFPKEFLNRYWQY